MKRYEFISDMITNNKLFKKNMNSLDIIERSKEDWMKAFLAWNEWTTDMHDYFWKQDTNE